jgi:hypothetical protein
LGYHQSLCSADSGGKSVDEECGNNETESIAYENDGYGAIVYVVISKGA